MKNMDEYVRDLTNRFKINKKAKRIVEISSKMEQDPYIGFHLPYPTSDKGDVIVGLETDNLRSANDYVVALWRITENGLDIITRDDKNFKTKMVKICKDSENKSLYLFNKEIFFELMPMCLSSHEDIVDLMENFSSPTWNIEKQEIPLPWNSEEYFEDFLGINDMDMAKLLCFEDSIRVYYMYILTKLDDIIDFHSMIPETCFRKKDVKIKLPKLVKN